MSTPRTPAYDALCQRHQRIHRLSHLQSIASWDQSAFMPSRGAQARAQALAEMDGLLHQLGTDPALKQLLDEAAQEPLDDVQRASLREMRRVWRSANAVPQRLVEARSLANSHCEHQWRQQRPANDWAGYVENLRPVVRYAREEAQYLADDAGLSRYDALLDQFEPGMRSAEVDRVFGDLRQWLPGLIGQVMDRQARDSVIHPQGPFPAAAQRALGLDAMKLLGFDFEAGRLDESAHPFCGGVPEDVRMTTRYRDDSFLQSLTGTIHETGHGRYEQNLPRAWLGLPVARARSMGLHESQSLSFEMQLAAHPGFAGLLQPLVERHLGRQRGFAADNLHKLMTRVAPGYIRVDADEVTYPAHVILRYEIERPLIEGEIEVEDIPALWDRKMQELLGLDTRGNYKDGCMQDVHWGCGLFGYFPCYTLGAMYAAQWFATMRRERPTLDEEIARGELAPVFDWLKDRIWSQGSRWETPELVRRASGEALAPAHFRRHLETRYLG
ncbi:carboxypeptidase Taq [Mitsuaria sp. BK045]|uniref:carboxypeptidase M32 n=1 Tax=unclassified Roseateles TaxID=2626991 RepID=UPI00160875EC|nr:MULTISPECIES: carboxypeptidase M32 [unclassified Roseateles]MBB3294690.1 carboxypeptidase Taq [Mitsuaria sp. BK041]MBB3363906.1 carboxypeptidase Taq [Mitsuaria sp. BK045]